MSKKVIGSGGKSGGGTGYTPREFPNTLQSKSVASSILLISEGPCAGLVDGGKSIYFDNVPLERNTSTIDTSGLDEFDSIPDDPDNVTSSTPERQNYNFLGVRAQIRNGLPYPMQETIQFSGDIGNNLFEEISFSRPLTREGGPVTISITDREVDVVLVKIRVDSLRHQRSNGDLVGSSVNIEFRGTVDFGDGTSDTVTLSPASNTITGKTTSPYERDYRFVVPEEFRIPDEPPEMAPDPVPVRFNLEIERTTADSEEATTVNGTSITSYTLIQNDNISYADSMVVGIEVDSSLFSQRIPRVTFDSQGVCVWVPENRYIVPRDVPQDYIYWYRYVEKDISEGADPQEFEKTHITAFWRDADGVKSLTSDDDTVTPSGPYSASVPLGELFSITKDNLIGQSGLTVPTEDIAENTALSYQAITESEREDIALESTTLEDFSVYYEGIWSGNWKLEYSDNPIWCMSDIITNSRYGLGNYLDSDSINKWGFYKIGKYCDALVLDGYGGIERRFTFNGLLNTREDAYRVLNTMASAFRGMLYWSEGQINSVQDSPKDPEFIVGPENVIDRMFNYEGVSNTTRHSAVLVSWTDRENNGNAAVEVVLDNDLLLKYGWRELEVTAFATNTRGQAYRLGKAILEAEKFESEIVKYSAALDHSEVVPGDIIWINDPVRSNIHLTGRVKSIENREGESAINYDDILGEALHGTSNGVRIEVGNSIRFQNLDGTITSDEEYGILESDTGLNRFVIRHRTRARELFTSGLNSEGELSPIDTFPLSPNSSGSREVVVFPETASGEYTIRMLAGTDTTCYVRPELETGIKEGGSSINLNSTVNFTCDEGDQLVLGWNSNYNANAPYVFELYEGTLTTSEINDPDTLPLVYIRTQGSSNQDANRDEATYTFISQKNIVLVRALPDNIQPNSMFVVEVDNVRPSRWRVVSVTQGEDNNNYDVIATKYEDTKYHRIDTDAVFDPPTLPNTSIYPTGPLPPPLNVTAEEFLRKQNNNIESVVVVSWTAPADPRVIAFGLTARGPDGHPSETILTGEQSHEFVGLESGGWEFAVSSAVGNSEIGLPSSTEIVSVFVEGKTAPPANVENFRAIASSVGVRLLWDKVDDLDLEIYRIRRSSSPTSWENAQPLEEGIKATEVDLLLDTSEPIIFYIRAEDTLGNLSPQPTSVVARVAPPADVQNFRVCRGVNSIIASWDNVFTDGTLVEIREGDSWEISNPIGTFPGVTANVPFSVSSARRIKFLARAISSRGLLSVGTAEFSLFLEGDLSRFRVASINLQELEWPQFSLTSWVRGPDPEDSTKFALGNTGTSMTVPYVYTSTSIDTLITGNRVLPPDFDSFSANIIIEPSYFITPISNITLGGATGLGGTLGSHGSRALGNIDNPPNIATTYFIKDSEASERREIASGGLELITPTSQIIIESSGEGLTDSVYSGRVFLLNTLITIEASTLAQSGIENVPASEGHFVRFGREYQAVPTVIASVFSGSLSDRSINIAPQRDGFFITVRGNSDEPVAATVSWSSLGF